MLAVVLVLAGVAWALTRLAAERAAWSGLSPDRWEQVRVGAVPRPMCCVHPAYTDCGYDCVVNPFCPAGTVTDGTCGQASCQPAPPNSVCSTPSRVDNYTGFRCTTTGRKLNCAVPPGTEMCETTFAVIQIPFTGCNVGESQCANQAPMTCQ